MKPQINITQEEWDIIENWLEQNKNLVRTVFWKEKLVRIPNLEKKIEYVNTVREEIEDSILQSKIKEFHKHISADNEPSGIKSIANRKIKSNSVWFTAAAVLVLLVGIYWMMDKSNPSEKIFAENFKPDIGLPLKMSTANANGFYEGMLEYKQGNYKEAIEKWEVLLKVNPESDTLNYFLGVANLALGNETKSLEYLENQECFRQSIFKEDAAYYTALAKIKEGKFEEAKVFLQKNPSARNTKLLNELNER